MDRRLSGLGLDYRILEIYSRDSGQRSAKISFNVGQGSQDIGFRNDVLIALQRAAGAAPSTSASKTRTASPPWRPSSFATV